MSDRRLFYLSLLVFVIGVVVLILGATAGSVAGTIVGLALWVVAALMIIYWLTRKRRTAS